MDLSSVTFTNNFISNLAASSLPNDLYTIMQGDPQFWWHCEQLKNTFCITETLNCNAAGDAEGGSYDDACDYFQGQFSNAQQNVGSRAGSLVAALDECTGRTNGRRRRTAKADDHQR